MGGRRFLPVRYSNFLLSLSAGVLAGALLAGAPAVVRAQQAQEQKPADQEQAQKPAPKPAKEPAQQEDSLAEAARKARANKPKDEPKKVYTDDDFGSGSSSRSTGGGEQSSGGSAADAANRALGKAGGATGGTVVRPNGGGGNGAGTGRNEAYWRQRAQGLRDQMAQVDAEIDKLQDEMKKGGNAGFNVQSGLKTDTVYFEDRETKMKRLQKKKADIQKQIDDLEDEARREEIPSSWIH